MDRWLKASNWSCPRAVIAGILSLSLVYTAHAQQVMDGSDKPFTDPVVATLIRGLIRQTPDPFSAQIIAINQAESEPNVYCGLVNLRGEAGGYTGFQPFMIDMKNGFVVLSNAKRCYK